MKARRGLGVVASLVLAGAGMVWRAPSGGADATQFTENGTFAVPAGVCLVDITAFGGAGGDGVDSDGGAGGGIFATFRVTPGSTLDVFVGKQGGIHTSSGGTGGVGFHFGGHADTGGGGGGGSSAVKSGATVLIVAGGGGGGSYDPSVEPMPVGGEGGAGGLGAADGDPGGGSNGGAGGITGDANTQAGPGGNAAGDTGGGGGAGSAPGAGGGGFLSGGGGGASAADASAVVVGSPGGRSAVPDGHVSIEPYAPGTGCPPVLSVKKVVTGTSKSGFTVAVDCTRPVEERSGVAATATEVVVDVDLPYTANGAPDANLGPPPATGWSVVNGTWQLGKSFLEDSACTVTETETAGATTVSYQCEWTPGLEDHLLGVGCPGPASGPSADPATVRFEGDGDAALITVTNVFPVVLPPTFTG